MPKRRVSFHYYRAYKCMSLHWKGQCYKVDNVRCEVPIETKWNKRQPQLVMQGFATDVVIEDGIAVIK